MPKGKATTEPESLQARIVEKLRTDKSIGGVVKLGSSGLLSDVPYYISTQCATLNYAIGRPGIPAAKVTTIFGREGSCKSTLGYHLLAETQQMGGIAVLIDAEQRYTRERGALMGLDPATLLVVDGATMEQAFEAIERVVADIRADDLGVPITVVYDSLAGSVPEKRMAAEVGDVLVGRAAALVSQELPRLKLKMARAGAALVIINQLRSRIHVLDPRNPSSYERLKVMGREQTMLAEWPLIFESALMIFLNSISNIGEDKEHPTGIRVRAMIRKSGISPREFWKAEFESDYQLGINRVGAKFELLEDLGYIKGIGGGRYRIVADGDEAKSFYARDFGDVLEARPELEMATVAAPTLWTAVAA